jgi:putative hemolysin
VTYRVTSDNGQAIAADAAAYCSSQGRVAQFRRQDGMFVTYDCITDPSQPFRTASYSTSTSYVPAPPVPTITYELASDGRSTLDAPAIRYCGMLGKSPVLRSQDGRRVTYECQ